MEKLRKRLHSPVADKKVNNLSVARFRLVLVIERHKMCQVRHRQAGQPANGSQISAKHGRNIVASIREGTRMCRSASLTASLLAIMAAIEPQESLFAQSSILPIGTGCIGVVQTFDLPAYGTTYDCMIGANKTAYRLWCPNGKVLDAAERTWARHDTAWLCENVAQYPTRPTGAPPTGGAACQRFPNLC
jgi:hypothetical protein